MDHLSAVFEAVLWADTRRNRCVFETGKKKKEESEIKAGIRTSDDDTYTITAAEHRDRFPSGKSPPVTTGYSSNSVTRGREETPCAVTPDNSRSIRKSLYLFAFIIEFGSTTITCPLPIPLHVKMKTMLDIGRCLSIFDTHKVLEAGCVS
jgi:hypothetical protein